MAEYEVVAKDQLFWEEEARRYSQNAAYWSSRYREASRLLTAIAYQEGGKYKISEQAMAAAPATFYAGVAFDTDPLSQHIVLEVRNEAT